MLVTKGVPVKLLVFMGIQHPNSDVPEMAETVKTIAQAKNLGSIISTSSSVKAGYHIPVVWNIWQRPMPPSMHINPNLEAPLFPSF